MTKYDNYDDTRVVLCDGAISTDAGMMQSSRTFTRDPRLAHPTDAMQAAEFLRDAFTPRYTPYASHEKWCCHCGEVRLKVMFSPDKRNWDGLTTWCKQCRNEAAHPNARAYRKREYEEPV